MLHLEEGVLHAMLDGEVGSTELKTIEAHLAGCPACRAQFDEARQFRDEAFAMITALDDAPVAAPSPPAAVTRQRPERRTGFRRWAPPLAWAATIVAAIGLGRVIQARQDLAPVPNESGTGVRGGPAPQAVAVEPRSADPAGERERVATQLPRDRRPPATPSTPSVARPAAPSPAPATKPTQSEARSEGAAADQAVVARELRAQPAAPVEPKRESNLAKKSLLAPAGSTADNRLALRAAQASPPPVTADKAIETLGGSIRLVDGLTPARFEQAGELIRVIYETSFGLLVLEQWRAANVVSHRLIAPPGAPADSVSAWTERVR